MKHHYLTVLFTALSFVLASCDNESSQLRNALRYAGENSSELEKVLQHYADDPEKLAAARYLIINMPAHYSYADTAAIEEYYQTALEVMQTDIPPEEQRETLREISDSKYPGLSHDVVSDAKTVTAEYLIYSIDHAFAQWRNKPWAAHLSFEEFRDWLLPYKVCDLQSLDHWRDTLAEEFSDSLRSVPIDDVKRLSIYGAIDIVRNEITYDNTPRVLWEERSGLKLLSASTLKNMTFGSCNDYVTMGVMTFRALGLPAAIDQVPIWGRNSEGHSWFTFLSDRGIETPTVNSLILPAGIGFYPYERCPKIYRSTFAINRDRLEYRNKARHPYPFGLCEEDVTGHYYRTSNPTIELRRDIRLPDRYACIAMLTYGNNGPEYKVIDYGRIHHHKVQFRNMGGNILYIAVGYDGNRLIPLSQPFIIRNNGDLVYITKSEGARLRNIELRRKYYQSTNVVEMRQRLTGSKIQYADRPDFSDAVTVWTIDTTAIPDKYKLPTDIGAHRFWRYLGADGTYGSIAELTFFDSDTTIMRGRPVANSLVPADTIRRAFDGGWLTNFESGEGQPDGIWVGMDFGEPQQVSLVRVIPRSDDNDICPGNKYELLWWDSESYDWHTTGHRIATDNTLSYDCIPSGTLLWLRNLTRGHDERPFVIDDSGEIIWW